MATWLGERLRRFALGLLAALITARAFWPSEVDLKAEAGTGLHWDLAILMVAGIALASWLLAGVVRVRWSWTDFAVIALTVLVGMSTSRAHDRRVAINLAWDWGAVGISYLLLRYLPRTRAESSTLVGAAITTAIAVSVYGLYHAEVEMPQTRAYYRAHQAEVLAQMGYAPGSTAALMFEKRLLDSSETTSTFALANSLAGFLVGPLLVMIAVGWENLRSKDRTISRAVSLGLGVLPLLAVLICLILTKSRSAYVGFAVGLLALAWTQWRRISKRSLVVALGLGLLTLTALVAVGVATRKLDLQVLTESPKSLGYRGEWWVGAWRVVTERSEVFWGGRGPGNFTAPYLRHKLPQSSEEIFDPHNLILETWATAGAVAALALVFGLGISFWNLIRPVPSEEEALQTESPSRSRQDSDWSDEPPARTYWLILSAGGGWILASLLGDLNPFEADLAVRWLILGIAWLWALLFGLQAWRRVPILSAGLGAGALAIAVNLLAAGGIGQSGVALMLWSLVALGLNLSTRSCGKERVIEGRTFGFGLAMVWAASVGIFIGAIFPFWKSEAAIAQADAALSARPPRFEEAEEAYIRAYTADKYSARPWLGYAYEKYREWEFRGAKVEDRRWQTIPAIMLEGAKFPRNQNSWTLHHERAKVTRQLLAVLGDKLTPKQLTTYRGNVVEATRVASRLYPSNATLHAELAIASAEIGMYSDAVSETEAAFHFDTLTPHQDKKLPDPLRKTLEAELPKWKEAAKANPIGTTPSG